MFELATVATQVTPTLPTISSSDFESVITMGNSAAAAVLLARHVLACCPYQQFRHQRCAHG